MRKNGGEAKETGFLINLTGWSRSHAGRGPCARCPTRSTAGHSGMCGPPRAERGTGSVESRMGAVAWAIRQRPVSHPRSSNRACRFPAPGFPTSFIEGHTGSDPTARGNCAANDSPSPSTQQPRTAPVFNGVARLIANHLDLAIFGSAPEVRALCSAGITRSQRSYDPVRLPTWPPP